MLARSVPHGTNFSSEQNLWTFIVCTQCPVFMCSNVWYCSNLLIIHLQGKHSTSCVVCIHNMITTVIVTFHSLLRFPTEPQLCGYLLACQWTFEIWPLPCDRWGLGSLGCSSHNCNYVHWCSVCTWVSCEASLLFVYVHPGDLKT